MRIMRCDLGGENSRQDHDDDDKSTGHGQFATQKFSQSFQSGAAAF